MKQFATLVIICAAHTLAGQAPLVKEWDRRYGGDKSEWVEHLSKTSNGGYILGGHSLSEVSGDKTQISWGDWDFWIVIIDSLGDVLHNYRYGGHQRDLLSCLIQTDTKGYVLGGTSNSYIFGDKSQHPKGGEDFWIIKIDSSGLKLWDRTFGGTLSDELRSMKQTTDGGYILGGSAQSDITGDKTEPNRDSSLKTWDYWIIKTDALGNKLWDKRFGGLGNDGLQEVLQTQDGGYLLGGSTDGTRAGDITEYNRGASYPWGTTDYWIVKTDAAGNKQWDKRYGGKDDEYLFEILPTNDGGFLLGGKSDSGISGDKSQLGNGFDDFWIVKIDAHGNKLWDRCYGGTWSEDEFGNISKTRDGGYLIAGTSYSDKGSGKSEDNLGSEQGWIVKIDSTGIKEWDKTIFTTGHDEMSYACETADSCYIILVMSDADIGGYKTQANWDTSFNKSYDFFSVKLCRCAIGVTANSITTHVSCINAHDGAAKVEALEGTPPYTFLWSDGQTTDAPTGLSAGAHSVTVTDANGCSATTSIIIGEGEEPCTGINDKLFNNLSLHPNPTSGSVTLSATGINDEVTLQMNDALGRRLLSQTFAGSVLQQGVPVDLKELPGNIFFLTLTTHEGSRVMKVVKH